MPRSSWGRAMSRRCAGTRQRPEMDEKIGQYIEIWKKLVDAQQHFNDIGMRLRATPIPLVVVLLGAAGYAHAQHAALAVLGHSLPAAFAIAVMTLVVWAAFYFQDRHWYHRLLNGAVEATRPIEQAIRQVI